MNKNEIFKEIATTIVKVVKEFSLTAEKEIDDKYKIQFAHSIFILTRIFTLLKITVDRQDQSQISDEEFESQILIWQACNSMIAAIQLIRQGYSLEPQFLMRTSIESFSLALSFYSKPDAFIKYLNEELTGNNSFTIAKKVLPELGQIYGQLSDVAHPSKRTTGNNYNEESHSLIIGGGYTDSRSHITLLNYSLLNYLLLTIWKGTELIFYRFEDDHNFWNENSDGTYEFKIDESIKQIVSSIGDDFRSALGIIKT